MNEQLIIMNPLLKKFNKNYGVITYSGTLAFEIALINANLPENAHILLIDNVCYTISNVIKKLGYQPIFIKPKNSFYLTNDEILNFIENNEIDCFVLVHMYGIYNNINLKVLKDKNIFIIEDVSQIWSPLQIDDQFGKMSDVIITSFGKTKPLSYGIGGALMFDNKKFYKNLDFCDEQSRRNSNVLISYIMHTLTSKQLVKLINKANIIFNKQNTIANKYFEIIKKYDFINCFEYHNPNNTWHRFPIWFDSKRNFDYFIKQANKYKLHYQLLHEIELCDLELYKNDKKIENNIMNNKEKYFFLLRTKNIDRNKQMKIFSLILKKQSKYFKN